ncbi:glycosyltransferase [Paenibacillus odorifer]|uniref:glycosyltransferase n=1 Tax=Paenibacillus odorifer TaxID=189426 RepID=UPI000BA1095B|nr:glycosyltransferase [Paenibacillus odorifer]OZQ78133.1 hypothetical protein CA596_05250 [Paenibacillus odorifer]
MIKTVSLCMIVKNEEKYLSRCLESVRNKVDEIIIVDTGSTDSTLEIAKQYTNNIYHFNWINDFAAARNESIKYATSEFILIMDADEYLHPDADLQKDISSSYDYYFIRIINDMSYGRTLKHTAIRLFANHKRLVYHNRLHEHLNVMDNQTKYKGIAGEFIIYHTGYTNEVLQEKEKKNRNLTLMLQEVAENPTGYNLFNMGKTYMWLGEHEKAIPYLQKAYSLSKDMIIIPEVIVSLCSCLEALHRYEEGLEILKDAIPIYPNETDMRHMQGCLFMEAGYTKDALTTFEKCLELGDQGVTVTEGHGGYLARFKMAEIYEGAYQLSKSYDQVLKVLEEKKTFGAGIEKYFRIVSKANIPNEEAYNNLQQIYSITELEDLKLILEVLYKLRHPLLSKYIDLYKVNIQKNVLIVAKQYSRKYEEAHDLWLSMEEQPKENAEDILLLAIILKDQKLLQLAIKNLNLSSKEVKILKAIISQELVKSITPRMERLLCKLSEQLIILQEFNNFQILLEYLLKGSVDGISSLGKLLSEYSFKEVAIDILVEVFKNNPNNVNIIRILGDICLNQNYLEDALLFYSKLLNLCPEYSTYERVYELYEILGDKEEMSKIKITINSKFPLSSLA